PSPAIRRWTRPRGGPPGAAYPHQRLSALCSPHFLGRGQRTKGIRAPSPNRAAERWPIDPTRPCDRFIPTQREIRQKNSTHRAYGRGNIMGRETKRPGAHLSRDGAARAVASVVHGRRSFLGGSG